MTDFAGIVFDLDGTITDNMAVHADAFALFVQSYGLPALTYRGRPLLGLASTKKHLSLFPFSPAVIEALHDRLDG